MEKTNGKGASEDKNSHLILSWEVAIRDQISMISHSRKDEIDLSIRKKRVRVFYIGNLRINDTICLRFNL